MYDLSVVVAIYNTSQYLERCINSLLIQKGISLDIILVNDGSTDGSEVIAEEYANNYSNIRVINQNNQGKLSARFAGVKVAQSDYVTFVDSDDWVEDDFYHTLLKYIYSRIDIIWFGSYFFYNDNLSTRGGIYGTEGYYDRERIEKDIFPSLIWNEKEKRFGVGPSLCTKLFRKELVAEQLKRAQVMNIGYGDDMAITFPALYAAHSLQIVLHYGYYYRQKTDMCPDYFWDTNFEHKLMELKEYLCDAFENKDSYINQIHSLVINAIRMRISAVYGEQVICSYLFPFGRVPKNSSVIIYGAGKIGKQYIKQIEKTNYCKEVVLVDKFAKNENVYNIEYLQKYDNQIIIVAIQNDEQYEQIYEELTIKYRVPKEQIVREILVI